MNANAAGFLGGAFDGRYVYSVPSYGSGNIVARYDTQAPFSHATSWSTFDTTTLGATVKGFTGAAVYFVPHTGGVVLRYDAQASFTTTSSWSAFDAHTVSPKAGGFEGAVFDGEYVYFIAGESGNATIARFDAKTPPSMPQLPGFFGSFL